MPEYRILRHCLDLVDDLLIALPQQDLTLIEAKIKSILQYNWAMRHGIEEWHDPYFNHTLRCFIVLLCGEGSPVLKLLTKYGINFQHQRCNHDTILHGFLKYCSTSPILSNNLPNNLLQHATVTQLTCFDPMNQANPLFYAVENTHSFKPMMLLLENSHVNINARNDYMISPLQHAIRQKKTPMNTKIIKLLLAAGAEIVTPSPNTSIGAIRLAPLALAIQHQKDEIGELLVFCGAPVNAMFDTNMNVLCASIVHNMINTCVALIDTGADLHQKTKMEGNSPLHLAAMFHRTQLVQHLLNAKIPVDIMNAIRQTPIETAVQVQESSVEIVKLLACAKADINRVNPRRIPLILATLLKSNYSAAMTLLSLNDTAPYKLPHVYETPPPLSPVSSSISSTSNHEDGDGAHAQATDDNPPQTISSESHLAQNHPSSGSVSTPSPRSMSSSPVEAQRPDTDDIISSDSSWVISSLMSTSQSEQPRYPLINVNVHTSLMYNGSPFLYACQFSPRFIVFKMITEHGANLLARNDDRMTALHCMIRRNFRSIRQSLDGMNDAGHNSNPSRPTSGASHSSSCRRASTASAQTSTSMRSNPHAYDLYTQSECDILGSFLELVRQTFHTATPSQLIVAKGELGSDDDNEAYGLPQSLPLCFLAYNDNAVPSSLVMSRNRTSSASSISSLGSHTTDRTSQSARRHSTDPTTDACSNTLIKNHSSGMLPSSRTGSKSSTTSPDDDDDDDDAGDDDEGDRDALPDYLTYAY